MPRKGDPVGMRVKPAEIKAVLSENTQLKKKVAAQARELSKIKTSLFEYKTELRALTSKLLMGEEAERKRIAVELHDRIGQDLLVTKLKLQTLESVIQTGAKQETVGQLIGLVDEIVYKTRTMTTRLSSPILYELGLKDAVSAFVEKMKESSDIYFFCDFTHKPVSADSASLGLLYRCICELIVNAVKHARAESVVVAIDKTGDQVQATIRDDGLGFAQAGAFPEKAEGTGWGLAGVKRSLAGLCGQVEIFSNSDECTEVVVTATCSID